MSEIEQEKVLTGTEKEKNTETVKCPGCGGNMVFDPEKQILKCEFCGTERQFEINANVEQDFEKLFDYHAQWSDETHVFSCNNCGAKVVVSKTDISKACPFCGTSNVIETRGLSGLKPNALVPFSITKENAVSRAIAWAKKKIFAPRRFKKYISHADEITGIYSPAFTFDTNTVSFYEGRLSKTETYTTRSNGKTVTHTRTVHFNIKGVLDLDFDDLLIQASSKIDQKTVDKLQPFDTNNSNEYTEEFLYGYSATQYEKDGRECWQEARKIIDKRIRAKILSRYVYTSVDYLKVHTQCNNNKFKYLLLPIYVGKFSYSKRADKRAKLYNFYVSGHNGKVVGKAPVSPFKVGGLVLGILGAVAAAVLISLFLL